MICVLGRRGRRHVDDGCVAGFAVSVRAAKGLVGRVPELEAALATARERPEDFPTLPHRHLVYSRPFPRTRVQDFGLFVWCKQCKVHV